MTSFKGHFYFILIGGFYRNRILNKRILTGSFFFVVVIGMINVGLIYFGVKSLKGGKHDDMFHINIKSCNYTLSLAGFLHKIVGVLWKRRF